MKNEDITYIYGIISKVTNYIYIGKTDREIDTRIDEHIGEIYRDEHIEKLQKDYSEHGEKSFFIVRIMKTKEKKLCELVLIELFSRLGILYNRNSGEGIEDVLTGNLVIPNEVYKEIEENLGRLCELTKSDYNKCVRLLYDIKDEIERTPEDLREKDIHSITLKSGFNLYNFEYKRYYLAHTNYSLETQKTVRRFFRKFYQFEVMREKDLYNFTIEEAQELLFALKAKTLQSFQNYSVILSKYLEFAINRGISDNKINYYQNLGAKENAIKYLNAEAEENTIFDKAEIMEMAIDSDNAQDGVILGLLFDGLSRHNEFEELIELTKDDVDFENKLIKLSDRVISMSDESKRLVENALDQDKKYVSISGENTRHYKIAEGNNVLRGSRNKSKVKGQLISQRILRIAKTWECQYLNATTVSYSGQVHYAKELINNGMTINDVTSIISKRFGINENPSSHSYLKTRIQKSLQKEHD